MVCFIFAVAKKRSATSVPVPHTQVDTGGGLLDRALDKLHDWADRTLPRTAVSKTAIAKAAAELSPTSDLLRRALKGAGIPSKI